MLAPHELKNKQFQKTFKGYNPQEVDEYLAFVLEKYTELYRNWLLAALLLLVGEVLVRKLLLKQIP